MEPLDLDVRPILTAGGEPFGVIMSSVRALAPGQALRLIATFRPEPLFQVLARQGFANETRQLDGGDWEVLFTPITTLHDPAIPISPTAPLSWPEPVRHVDCTMLDPPLSAVLVLNALQTLSENDVLFALLSDEPLSLFPELEARGHRWYGQFDVVGSTYPMFILVGACPT